jgi:hypothetical protein
MFRGTLVYGVLLGIAAVSCAEAGVIGVNFTGGGAPLAATDQPGVVAGANWNNEIGGSGSNLVLNDSTGAATTALLQYSATGPYAGFTGTSTGNAATNRMYSGGLFGDNTRSEVSVSVSNIPYASYEVFVYASADTTAGNTLSITNGVVTFYYRGNGTFDNTATSLLLTTSTNPASPTVGPGQYQLFSGLSGSTFTLTTGGSLNGVLSNNVFGLEIVDTSSSPEPATVLMLVGGLGLLALARRRRARKA